MRAPAPIAFVVFAGCAGGGGGHGGLSAALYVPEPGLELLYVPNDDPYQGSLEAMEAVDGGKWELRDGYSSASDDWEEGSVVEDFDVTSDEGLQIGDTLLLPQFFQTGTHEHGVEVTDVGSGEVYYGTFEQTATVEIADGRWKGTQILASGFGLIRFTLDGATRDLATYNPPAE